MKVEESSAGLWVIRDLEGNIIETFKTNSEAWRWLERNERDPLWVKSSRRNRADVEGHHTIKVDH